MDDEIVTAVNAAFRAFNERRFADFATYVTDDVVELYPQSGERIEGRDRQQAFHEAFPEPPTFTVRNVLRSGDLAVAEVDEHAADGSVWYRRLDFRAARRCRGAHDRLLRPAFRGSRVATPVSRSLDGRAAGASPTACSGGAAATGALHRVEDRGRGRATGCRGADHGQTGF